MYVIECLLLHNAKLMYTLAVLVYTLAVLVYTLAVLVYTLARVYSKLYSCIL